MVCIAVKGVSKSFRGKGESTVALDQVDLEICSGIHGLLGPNGAGKTTLISIMAGLILPDSGTIEIMGKTPEQAKDEIGIISGFSQPLHGLRVRELLKYYGFLYGKKISEKKIDEILDSIGLRNKENEVASYMSSGQKQRFYVAKALINEPKFLFLDEPTVGLDVKSAHRFREHVKELKEKGITILLTTHNMQEAEMLCDVISVISRGKIIFTGTAGELKKRFKAEELEQVFLELGDDEDG